MKREHTGMILLGILMVVLLATIITIKSNTHRDDDDDGGWVENENEGGEEIFPQLIELEVKDAFTTDKLSSRMIPGEMTNVWLVLKVRVTNLGNQTFNHSGPVFYLRHSDGVIFPFFEKDIINNSLLQNRSLPVNATVEGWTYFDIDPTIKNIVLEAVDDWNCGFYGSYNLTGQQFDHRQYSTHLEMVIIECGRDGQNDPHPGLFYMNISVKNHGENATVFENWHLKLNVTGEGVRDVMFGIQPENPYIYGGEIHRFKLYFDIAKGSPELPETLYSKLNWIFVDVDPDLYSHVI